MKILIFNTTDNGGGAAKAILKIHKTLIENKINSFLFVLRKNHNEKNVLSLSGKSKQLFISYIRVKLDNLLLKFYPHYNQEMWNNGWFPFGINKILKKIRPDVVILNWISGGFLSTRDVGQINVPIIWRLPDSYAFTGGCHLSYDCERYKEKCGKCPILGSHKTNDLSRWNWNRKYKYLKSKNIVFICPSRWMAQRIQESALFKNFRTEIIPTGVDIQIFQPIDRNTARTLWGMSHHKKILTFGSVAPSVEKYKGFQYLVQMLKGLDQQLKEDLEVWIFGQQGTLKDEDVGCPVNYTGYITDAVSMSLFYNASDLFVIPSVVDTLPNTGVEAIACGTPVVAFDVCGLPDIIDHKKNGYLAKPFLVSDLTEGVAWILQNPDYESLSLNARQKAVDKFDLKKVGTQFKMLCENIAISQRITN